MQQQITFNFDEQIIERANLFARKKGTSLNKIIEAYLQLFISNENSSIEENIEYVAQTISGKQLTKKEFQEHIYSISSDVKNGNYISHEEMLKELDNEE